MSADVKTLYAELCCRLGVTPGEGADVATPALVDFITRALLDEGDRDEAQIAKIIEETLDIWFSYMAARYAQYGSSDRPDHVEASKMKIEAGANTRNLQKIIVQYALCFFCIQSGIRILGREIARVEKESDIQPGAVMWSYDLPPQVALMTKKRKVLSDHVMRIRRTQPMVTRLDAAFSAFEKGLRFLMGAEGAQHLIEQFTALLRQHHYEEAHRLLQKTGESDMRRLFLWRRRKRRQDWHMIREAGAIVISHIQKMAPRLAGREGRIFLRAWEVNLAYDTMTRELEAARHFLARHELPEIQYRREALGREADRLAVLGPLEKQLNLFEAVLRGRFMPLATLKDVRAFESGVLNRVYHMMQDVSPEIGRIEKRALALRCGPDPESIPDDELYRGVDEALQKAAMR